MAFARSSWSTTARGVAAREARARCSNLTCEDVERGARERSGQTMVETVVERLAALNPGVDGAATTANARATANAGKEQFERYDAVVAGGGGLSDHDHRALARACAESGTVLVTTRARGLFGESADERERTMGDGERRAGGVDGVGFAVG